MHCKQRRAHATLFAEKPCAKRRRNWLPGRIMPGETAIGRMPAMKQVR